MKIFSCIKRVLSYIFGGYEKDSITRELLKIQPFDVVSTVRDPGIHDLYVVYSMVVSMLLNGISSSLVRDTTLDLILSTSITYEQLLAICSRL